MLDHFELSSLTRAEMVTWNERCRLGNLAPTNPRLVFLAIDAPSVSLDMLDEPTIAGSKALSLMKGGWPFSHEVYSEVCQRLLKAGARVVAFDLIFQKPSPADEAFRKTMDQFPDQIVIGFNFKEDLTSYALPPSTLLPSGDPTDEQVGYFNFWPDEDGVIRRVRYRTNLEFLNSQNGAEKLPIDYSLSARVIEKAVGDALIPRDMEEHTIRFANTDRHKIKAFSFYSIFDPHAWENNFRNGEFFKDKIVLVGPEGNWSKHAVGISRM